MMPIDLTQVESQRDRRIGDKLQCPRCGKFVPALLILDTAELFCRKCVREVRSKS